jgi:hypothetical protein
VIKPGRRVGWRAAFDYDAQHHPSPSTGDNVARAKRTSSERAAARRRYRAAIESESLDGEASSTEAGATGSAPPTSQVAQNVRVGIVTALRASIHPLNVREDLAALPSLVTHKALWIPVLVTVASTAAVIATGGKDSLTAILFAYFVQTPAIGGVFLAGFLAPRASWLLGAIVGVVAAIGYVAVLSVVPGSLSPAPGTASLESVAISAFLLSPVMGALFASAAAWYKRFLSLTNPNRGRRNQPPKKGVDGRTRAASGQKPNTKAPARR